MEHEILDKRIVSHSEYFNQMLELIPPFAYFTQQSGTIQPNNTHIFKKSGVQSYKIKNKEKQIAKFDPENYPSVPKILQEQSKKGKDDDDETEDTKSTNSEIVPGFVESDIVTVREELKKRLREKLNALRTKRNAPTLSDDSESKSVEPPAKRRKIEERRKEKLKKKEDSKKMRKGSKGSPCPAKIPKTPSQSQTQSQKSVDDSTIEFETFDFSSGAPVPTYLQNKKKTSRIALLKQVQEKKKKLNEHQGTEEGDRLAKQEAWATMKKRAQGEKVKNDAEKLKKTIKREQQQKKRSKKEWDQRISIQKRTQIASQKKRAENIAAAKERKRDKRYGIKKKEILLKISTPWF